MFRLAAFLPFGLLASALPALRAQDLAIELATPAQRDAALRGIALSGGKDLPLLLSWSKKAPAGVDEWELRVGLADAFRILKAREAIPFLVNNIDLERYFVRTPFWLKDDSVIQNRLPAAAALIAIGPDASRALVAADWSEMSPRAHIAAIYTISRIADPAARDFLASVHAEDLEVEFVREGITAIDAKSGAPVAR